MCLCFGVNYAIKVCFHHILLMLDFLVFPKCQNIVKRVVVVLGEGRNWGEEVLGGDCVCVGGVCVWGGVYVCVWGGE